MEYLSKERHDEITAELHELIDVKYPEIKDALSEARAQGDLSENYEYRSARRAQAKTISRIKYLQKILEHSRIIDTNTLPKDQVTLLSKVSLVNLDTGARMEFIIVSPHETDLQAGKISIYSPIGKALMGKKTGESVSVQAPATVLRFKIEGITVRCNNSGSSCSSR